VIARMVKDSPDPVRLGGISQIWRNRSSGFRAGVPATILGHVQRGGTPEPADRVLATLFGHKAWNWPGRAL